MDELGFAQVISSVASELELGAEEVLGRALVASRAATPQPSYFLADETWAPLDEAINALAAESPSVEPFLAAAQSGALAWGRALVNTMREMELSSPLAELQAADSDEWWQAEGLLNNCAMQIAVLTALTGQERLDRVTSDSGSAVYVRQRRAVEEALGWSLPQLAVIVVDDPSPTGDVLKAWVPPREDEPWALILTYRPESGGPHDLTLLHELIHTGQPQFLFPVSDDKEFEWLLGVGNRTLIEGATETLAREIEPRERALYATEVKTCARLAARLGKTPHELAMLISANSYPLETIAELVGDDAEQLAWDIIASNVEEIEKRDARPATTTAGAP